MITRGYRDFFLPLTEKHCEETHGLVLGLLGLAQKNDLILDSLEREFCFKDKRLEVEVFGARFPNPILLAAGMDRNAKALASWASLGLGGIEIGSVTWQAREGNPKKRLEKGRIVKRMMRFNNKRIIVNYMGFPGLGTAKTMEIFRVNKERARVPVGVNVAISPGLSDEKQRRDDLGWSLGEIYSASPDWVTFNVSCPNNYGGSQTRGDKMQETLWSMRTLAELRRKEIPCLVKIGPDLKEEEIFRLVKVAKELGFEGIVAVNTTVERPEKENGYPKKGGLSGDWLYEKALRTVELVREFDGQLEGDRLAIIGCGGIMDGSRVKEMREAGADLMQVLSGLVFGGPYFVKNLLEGANFQTGEKK